MKIFLSWSGERSKHIAEAFKEWLPNVLQYVDPYMSSKDIELGERWSSNIEDNLRAHEFGLVFVTPENIDAPWINFEAGALTKNLKSRVIPILFESDVSILNQGPLKQFQSQKNLDEASIQDLVLSINSAGTDVQRVSNERVEKSFNMWWSELEKKLASIPELEEEKNGQESDTTVNDKASLMILKKLDEIQINQSKHNNSKNQQELGFNRRNSIDIKKVQADFYHCQSSIEDALEELILIDEISYEQILTLHNKIENQTEVQMKIFNHLLYSI